MSIFVVIAQHPVVFSIWKHDEPPQRERCDLAQKTFPLHSSGLSVGAIFFLPVGAERKRGVCAYGCNNCCAKTIDAELASLASYLPGSLQLWTGRGAGVLT